MPIGIAGGTVPLSLLGAIRPDQTTTPTTQQLLKNQYKTTRGDVGDCSTDAFIQNKLKNCVPPHTQDGTFSNVQNPYFASKTEASRRCADEAPGS
jgi:hypothetical protein